MFLHDALLDCRKIPSEVYFVFFFRFVDFVAL